MEEEGLCIYILFKCFFLFSFFFATTGDAHESFMTLHLGITPGRAQETI